GGLQLRKGEQWMNTFSIVLSYVMQCNTDVACLLSGTQVQAVIVYITDYVMKPGLKMYIVFETVWFILSNSAEIVLTSSSKPLAAKRIIMKIVNALTSQMKVEGPMVCSHLLGHPDHYTDKKFRPCYWYSYVRLADNAWATDGDGNRT
ncbi:uncharacterized protein PHACADRAFT_54578, partial [Phanerochaete carnosa HHB-10118-sp]